MEGPIRTAGLMDGNTNKNIGIDGGVLGEEGGQERRRRNTTSLILQIERVFWGYVSGSKGVAHFI